ncbi:MAG TPA: hypothetical protein VMZ53_03180 [Kofleriaceae bacterium]|nr:hypothetical protein [Kofleriaceae bacterium]
MMIKRSFAVLALACMVSSAAAAPKKKGGGKKLPPKQEEPAPPPEPAPAPPPEPVSTEVKPWAEGVPQDQQDKARALYEEGNTLFGQQALTGAYEKYKEAIKLWEHPLIRYNLAVTEIRLEKILDAAEDLEKALKWGDKPFKPELYQEAQNYQALIKGQVGYVEVTCDQGGARLLFDGKPWFDCPGTKKLRVLAGVHAIVGEKKDFLTQSTKIVVTGDKVEKANIKLLPLDTAVVLKYPYRRWIPWTMTAVGLVVGAGGAGTWFLGKQQMDKFHDAYAVQCANGCEPGLTDPSHSSLAAQRDSAQLKGKIGIGMMGVGGAVAVTGIVLAIMNRPERVLPNVEVAPTSGGGVTSVGWSF